MTPAYTPKLGLKVRKTNVDAQTIDGSLLIIYGIVIAALQILNKLNYSLFF